MLGRKDRRRCRTIERARAYRDVYYNRIEVEGKEHKRE